MSGVIKRPVPAPLIEAAETTRRAAPADRYPGIKPVCRVAVDYVDPPADLPVYLERVFGVWRYPPADDDVWFFRNPGRSHRLRWASAAETTDEVIAIAPADSFLAVAVREYVPGIHARALLAARCALPQGEAAAAHLHALAIPKGHEQAMWWLIESFERTTR